MKKYFGVKDIIEKFGVENVEFFHPARPLGVGWEEFRKSNFNANRVRLFKVDETFYKISDGYKIVLAPDKKGFYQEEYYQQDFESLARTDGFENLIFVKINGVPYHFGFDESVPEMDESAPKI